MILTETPRRQKITKLVSWGHWFSLCNIVIAIVIAGIYLFSSPLPDTLLGLVYLLTNWFSHIGFLTFFGFVIFILPLCYVFPNSRFLRGYSSAVAALGLAFLAFDALLYTRYGLHISINTAELVKQQTFHVISEFGWRQFGFLAVLFLVWFLFQLMLANAIFKRLERLQKLKIALPVSSVFVVFFMFSHITHIWADAKLYSPILNQDDLFPLSYPATAKTLMSKYGLFNIEDYRNKKQLKFDRMFDQVAYPKEPLYCTVDTQQRTLLLVSLDSIEEKNLAGLTALPGHIDMSTDNVSGINTILYGLPDLYHREVSKATPLLLDIPNKLGLPVSLHINEDSMVPTEFATTSWPDTLKLVTQPNAGLFVVFAKSDAINEVLAARLPEDNVLLTQLAPNSKVTLATNFVKNAPSISNHQDIASTTLAAMGCKLDTTKHSTGRDLNQTSRTWLVASQLDKIVVLNNGLRSEVDRNGNYQVYELDGTPLNNENLDIGLLGQAIKLISSFSASE